MNMVSTISVNAVWIIFFICVFPRVSVYAAPVSHINEELTATYHWNGSLDGNISRAGYVEVDVGNPHDVMQYLLLELDGTFGTNLQGTTAYNDFAASPSTGDRTRIFVNTTDDAMDYSYMITNQNLIPVIGISMVYQNDEGGQDIYSTLTNNFTFNVTLTTTKDVLDATLIFQTAKNTRGMNDSFDFFSPQATSGIAQIVDTDSDGIYDRVEWDGDLVQGSSVMVSFRGHIKPGSSFEESYMYVNIDSGETRAYQSISDQTFTGISFIDRFSRGSVRQGIEMMDRENIWFIRGFLKNMATGLDYIVHGWDLYKIGNTTPVLSSSESSYLAPGEIVYTEWYDTGETQRAYYSSAFDWEVTWGGSGYSRVSESNMHMPTLYEIDSWVDKTVLSYSNTSTERTLSVTDTIRHLGHSSLSVDMGIIYSVIPYLSTKGVATSWNISNLSVNYYNASGQFDITNQVSIITKNSNPGEDGYVYVNASNLINLLGGLEQNEDIVLSYHITCPMHSENQLYPFFMMGSLVTQSGTPVTKSVGMNFTTPGTGIPEIPEEPEPPGPSGGPSGPPGEPGIEIPPAFADLMKESSKLSLITPGFVMVNVSYRVIDTGDKGIKDVKAVLYIPEGGRLEKSDLSLSYYRAVSGTTYNLERDKDFEIIDNGPKKIGERSYIEYLIKLKTPPGEPYERTLDLYNDEKLYIGYTARIPFGTNYILTRVFGYNYYDDKIIFEDVYTPVRRDAELDVLEFEEGEWEVGKVEVGKPVRWLKKFKITNPNKLAAEELFSIEVFPDVLTANLVEYTDGERKIPLELKKEEETYVNWIARLEGLESKLYVIEVTTPPVIKVKETLDVLESSEVLVKFINNITLRNFAMHTYTNISLLYPVSIENIISIGGLGVLIEERGDETVLIIDRLNANESMDLSIIYKQKPPILVTTPDALRYGCFDYANVSVLIIPSEDERFAYLEAEVVGPESEFKTAWIDLIEIGQINRFREEKISMRLDLSPFPDGKYLFISKFKKNFGTILSDQREFFIDCPERQIVVVNYVVFIAIGAALVVMVFLRIYRRRTYEKEIEKLKKKIRKL